MWPYGVDVQHKKLVFKNIYRVNNLREISNNQKSGTKGNIEKRNKVRNKIF